MIVLAETKLEKNENVEIKEALSNWKIIGRYDVDDSRKHMGLLLLKSKQSSFSGKANLTYQTFKRNQDIQVQGLISKCTCDILSRLFWNNIEDPLSGQLAKKGRLLGGIFHLVSS